MLSCLALTWVLSISPAQTHGTAVDASAARVRVPATVAELDLEKLKGELRQIGCSRDCRELYVQTVVGEPASQKLRHYLMPLEGGARQSIDQAPEWATDHWGFKSDRFARGLRSLMIDFEQKQEKTRIGTGTGRPGDAAAGPASAGVPVDIENTSEGQYQNYARLTFMGETISEFVNQVPIPGLMFSWGPVGSGAMAYTDREAGHLMLIDQHKHKQTLGGIKDALLPAWSIDGTRLAWAYKSGRKKYTLVWAKVATKG